MIDRHTKDCESKWKHDPGRACNCGVGDGDPHWYKRKLSILADMKNAFNKCKHYQDVTKRQEKFFQDALPGYSVHVVPAKASYESHKFHVWGKGLRYDDGVDITLYGDKSATWQALFESHLQNQVHYYTTAIAEMEREEALVPQLEGLLEEYNALMYRVSKCVEEGVSSDLTRMFPELF